MSEDDILQAYPDLEREDLLTEELLGLPQVVRELAEGLRELAEAQRHVAQRIAQVEDQIGRLAQQMERLTEVQVRMSTDLERLKGSDLERRYRERAPAYFGRLVRKAHALSHEELAAILEDARSQRMLSDDHIDDLLAVDLVVRGRRPDGQQDVYLVVEVSWGVGIEDVERAADRAAILARTGMPVVPVVAGPWVTPDARVVARDRRVWQVMDGRVVPPEAA